MKTPPEILDKLILLIVSGVGESDLLKAAVEKLSLSPAQAARSLKSARRKITIAADFNRDAEVGTAYLRLNDLYTRCLKIQDTRTALAAQRELNKLLNLYEQPAAMEAAGAVAYVSKSVPAEELLAVIRGRDLPG